MAKIFGQELTKKEMLERLGNISSLAGITLSLIHISEPTRPY